MSNPNDGGPAFPRPSVEITEYERNWGQKGMSLRDWFAGMALQGIVQAVTAAQLHHSAQTPDDDTIASWAYGTSDAMLAARGKGHEQLRDSIQQLRTEVDCRVQHGASSGGHLEYVLEKLDSILKQ